MSARRLNERSYPACIGGAASLVREPNCVKERRFGRPFGRAPCDRLSGIPFAALKERGPQRQKSSVERFKAEVEPLLT